MIGGGVQRIGIAGAKLIIDAVRRKLASVAAIRIRHRVWIIRVAAQAPSVVSVATKLTAAIVAALLSTGATMKRRRRFRKRNRQRLASHRRRLGR